jgi:GNAT superfamily N-acetyltransferase
MAVADPPMAPDGAARLVAAAAANLAAWHDLHLRSLGHRTAWRDGLWLAPDRVPVIFFSAIAVRPGADPLVVASGTPGTGWTAACDPWADLPLAGVGYQHVSDQPWMSRLPAPVPADPLPAGLSIERVASVEDLVRFEATAAAGFESGAVAPHTWHGPAVLADPRLAMWLGMVEGRAATVAMGFREAGVLGIYGVATVPSMRRRGFATALTSHAIASGPDEPAVLQPSAMAEPLYGRLGFRRFGAFRTWARVAGA